MTAVAAWIRGIKKDVEELCIISDSRLSDGRNIDCAPKIFPLPRGDIALCFAGETQVAYPFLQQVYFTSLSFRAARTRGLDIIEYRPHVLRILNEFLKNIDTPIKDLRIPSCTFLLCGYSWIQKSFRMWTIKYHPELKRFHHDKSSSICGRKESIIFGGDAGPRLMRETKRILRARRGPQLGKAPLNFEPLEALSNLLKIATNDDSIGGAPQLVKIYQHINTTIVPIYWPQGQSENIYFLGRKLLGYERIDDWILNIDDLKRYPHEKQIRPID